jgi:peptide deformylase
VETVDDDLRALMDDMLETMYAAPGIGLAAIQVGVPKRVIVMDLPAREEKQPRFFVNPRSSGQSRRPRPTRRAACRCRRSTTRSSGRRR